MSSLTIILQCLEWVMFHPQWEMGKLEHEAGRDQVRGWAVGDKSQSFFSSPGWLSLPYTFCSTKFTFLGRDRNEWFGKSLIFWGYWTLHIRNHMQMINIIFLFAFFLLLIYFAIALLMFSSELWNNGVDLAKILFWGGLLIYLVFVSKRACLL